MTLREVTLAREQRYRADPSKTAPEGPQSTVEVKVTSIGDLNEQARSLKSQRAWTISEPKHVGGLANAPTPLEHLLSGAVRCFAAVFARGHMIEDAPPSGFRRVRLDVTVGGAREDLERILQLALRGCPASRRCATRSRSTPGWRWPEWRA